MMSSSEYLFWKSEFSFTKYVFVPKYQMFVSTVTVFENEGFSDNTSESVFQFLVKYSWIKRGKIKRLVACYMVKIKDLGCANNSLEVLRILIWFIPFLVGCLAVIPKTLLNVCKQFCEKNG